MPCFWSTLHPNYSVFFSHFLSSFYFSALYTHSDHINTHIYNLEAGIHRWKRTCGLCLPRSYLLHLAENFTFLHDWIQFCSSRFTINAVIINPFANGHPGCFYHLTIVKRAAINKEVHAPLQKDSPLCYVQKHYTGSYGSSDLKIWESSMLLPEWVALPVKMPTNPNSNIYRYPQGSLHLLNNQVLALPYLVFHFACIEFMTDKSSCSLHQPQPGK